MIEEIREFNKSFVKDEKYQSYITSKYPDKKLASVKQKSIKKRFNETRFAKGANRQFMMVIEETGITFDEFILIAMDSMKKISDVLGL